MPNIFLTGDTHWSHRHIIQYSNRPFATIKEMDEQLITNWNAIIKPGDLVYHIGDIFLCRPEKAEKIMDQLNGCVYLISGNHEKTAWAIKNRFGWIKDYYRLKVPDPDANKGVQEVILFHYAMRVWDKCHYGSFAAYGHSHSSLSEDPNARSCDVGVDAVAHRLAGNPQGSVIEGNPTKPEDYRPISYDEFKGWMLKKLWKPIDHHGKEE